MDEIRAIYSGATYGPPPDVKVLLAELDAARAQITDLLAGADADARLLTQTTRERDAAREELCERTHALETLKWSIDSDWVALRAELDAARTKLTRMTERSKSYEQAWLDAAACREDARAEAARFRAALDRLVEQIENGASESELGETIQAAIAWSERQAGREPSPLARVAADDPPIDVTDEIRAAAEAELAERRRPYGVVRSRRASITNGQAAEVDACRRCKGRGRMYDLDCLEDCAACGGTGRAVVERRDYADDVTTRCSRCDGTGRDRSGA